MDFAAPHIDYVVGSYGVTAIAFALLALAICAATGGSSANWQNYETRAAVSSEVAGLRAGGDRGCRSFR